MKRIHWLIPYQINNPEELKKVSLASIRVRTCVFLEPVFQKKFDIQFNSTIQNIDNIDYLFISKFGKEDTDCSKWQKYLNDARDRNIQVFFDYTDHHLEIKNSYYGNFIRKNLNDKDQMIVPSKLLYEELKKINISNCHLIEDILEYEIQELKYKKTDTLLWFGHHRNLIFLWNFLEDCEKCRDYKIKILTSDIGINLFEETLKNFNPYNINNIELINWSKDNLIRESKNVSGVLIPGDLNSVKKYVGNNRLLTALALGLPVLATQYRSYSEFKNYFFNIDDKKELNSFFESINSENLSQFENLKPLLNKYSAKEISKKWHALLK